MKNLKFLSFLLLCGIVVVAWCEKTNNPEKLSCEGNEVCPIENVDENVGIIIEDSPSVIVEANDDSELVSDESWMWEEWTDQPMMRKMMVDENSSLEEIEISVSQTCEALWWSWIDWECTLQDGSKIYF